MCCPDFFSHVWQPSTVYASSYFPQIVIKWIQDVVEDAAFLLSTSSPFLELKLYWVGRFPWASPHTKPSASLYLFFFAHLVASHCGPCLVVVYSSGYFECLFSPTSCHFHFKVCWSWKKVACFLSQETQSSIESRLRSFHVMIAFLSSVLQVLLTFHASI